MQLLEKEVGKYAQENNMTLLVPLAQAPMQAPKGGLGFFPSGYLPPAEIEPLRIDDTRVSLMPVQSERSNRPFLIDAQRRSKPRARKKMS